jgi:hypothetical protein
LSIVMGEVTVEVLVIPAHGAITKQVSRIAPLAMRSVRSRALKLRCPRFERTLCTLTIVGVSMQDYASDSR